MKSMLFSALMIFALASSGCALQSGPGAPGGTKFRLQLPLSGDCGCSAPRGVDTSDTLLRKLGDNRGMGLRINQKGAACNQNRNNGLFSRMSRQPVAPVASMGMGCDSCSSATSFSMGDGGCNSCGSATSFSMGDGGCNSCGSAPVVSMGGNASIAGISGDCGCGDSACGGVVSSGAPCDGGSSGRAGLFGKKNRGCGDSACGGVVSSEVPCDGGSTGRAGLFSKKSCGCKLGGCKLGDCKLCKLGGCKLGKCKLGGLFAKKGGEVVEGGCGNPGCGVGGRPCGGCLSKLAAAHQHPYGGAIPHTAQGPGAGTGTAPQYAYPYYTTRGPRDFLMKNPPSIGY